MRQTRPVLQTEQKHDTALRGSFLRAVATRLHVDKLGDLLVLGGLITPQQLEEALAEQHKNHEPLGKILVRQKSVSAVHLYRKLAEQWCLRASTAGLTLLIQTVPTTLAQAELAPRTVLSPQFTLAAAAPAPMKSFSYPGLFGTHEIRSNDIKPFTKWTDVIRRFEAQMQTISARAPKVMLWKAEIQRLKNKPQQEQVAGVNAFMNQIPYIEDRDNYGKSDYWATPVEFLTHGGDCEDFAVAKYASLRALGFTPDQLRVAIVQDQVKNIPHAILIVYTGGKTFVLDNQNKNLQTADAVTRYKPIFSINASSWWLHKA